MKKSERTYDAIVVGSGICGGWAAKELCELGLNTLVIERGPHLDQTIISGHLGDKSPGIAGFVTREERSMNPIQSKSYAYDHASKGYFVSDADHPYNQVRPFYWIRGYQLGGRSITWNRQCYRMSDLDFEANVRDGYGIDWPIRYANIEAWYSYVERFAGISGAKDGIDVVPDGEFLPAMEMTAIERRFADLLPQRFDGRVAIIGRSANLTADIDGRGRCRFINQCHRGCPTSGYFSSLSATLPAARATGRLTVVSDTIASEVKLDARRDMASGVITIDAKSGEQTRYKARLIFLAASTLSSTHILLNSTSARFPEGFGNDSGVLGKYLMDHHSGVGAVGRSADYMERGYKGSRPNGIYVPRFVNTGRKGSERDYLRGFAFQGGSWKLRDWTPAQMDSTFVDHIGKPIGWEMWLGGWGEHLPSASNRVTLNREKLDKWGLPTLDIDCRYGDNESKMRNDMRSSAVEMLGSTGFTDVKPFEQRAVPGFSVHEMGTARMGRSANTSILNGFNQVHSVPNVYVTDGSCMTSSAVQNPSLTYMALTARACHHAVAEMKRLDI